MREASQILGDLTRNDPFKTHMVKLHGKNALDPVWGLFTFQTGDEPTIVNLMGQLEMRGANAAP